MDLPVDLWIYLWDSLVLTLAERDQAIHDAYLS